GDDPDSREIALLTKVGAENPDIEVLSLDTTQPALQDSKRRVDRYCLTVVGWSAGSDWPGIGSIVPEERPHTGPIPVREPAGILPQQLVNRILIPPGTRGGTILDSASRRYQNTEAEDRRQTQT